VNTDSTSSDVGGVSTLLGDVVVPPTSGTSESLSVDEEVGTHKIETLIHPQSSSSWFGGNVTGAVIGTVAGGASLVFLLIVILIIILAWTVYRRRNNYQLQKNAMMKVDSSRRSQQVLPSVANRKFFGLVNDPQLKEPLAPHGQFKSSKSVDKGEVRLVG
jgi:hypothetical protein